MIRINRFMKKILPNDSINVDVRHLMSVKSTPKSYEKTNHSVFILAHKITLLSKNFTTSGTFASICNTEFTVSNNDDDSRFLAINLVGFHNPEEKLSILNNVNEPGHLSYIDGCSNTNLIDPSRNGDPCLNYLHIPNHVSQSFHTHPSIRIGIVVSGEGFCSLKTEEIPLSSGDMFLLESHELHRFRTVDSHLSVIVFHPDSDSGPTDEGNPMKTRTYVQK
jgi:mannose-6-phosphate isomerase-like protein (cupin superfamily)